MERGRAYRLYKNGTPSGNQAREPRAVKQQIEWLHNVIKCEKNSKTLGRKLHKQCQTTEAIAVL